MRIALTAFLGLVLAWNSAAEPLLTVPLWSTDTPGAKGDSPNDIPTLTVYRPEGSKPNAPAMIICPGGGYWGLASHEGPDYALFLNRQGVTCFVLRYRLAQFGYHHPTMLLDVSRAMRLVRHKAEEFGVDPHRIGIMGSSAGGHLASTLMTHFDAGNPKAPDPVDSESSRPDLGVLCYAVITMGEFTHQGSKDNLLGKNPDPALVTLMSNEKQVTKDTPPAFVWHTWEDKAVPVENSLQFAAALQKNGVPFDLHIYQNGGHGIGLQSKPPEFAGVHPWGLDLVYWLKARGFLAK
ncbi:MAG TPA: alpha/beta hydrolase [Candidatus Limnocylindria bacterium]|jgi:acetyl esterase/lipase|nr:alpha/beta hydrolase [Candidatus Limnocylindria bacterium]